MLAVFRHLPTAVTFKIDRVSGGSPSKVSEKTKEI